ncbi:DMT family transporter [Jeongeupia chitinilytica]|uniref:Guanidinium exporter n=1 Tax=Jeongeupia chitinilytica TaxID=1041641 RepID=A0ABQ3GZ02_9NEIS|nr:multidrug efflux SMR transporter [Jeongeupia chitinilytica]GHD59249.1 transporter [Jeongeupia chitinilytica]
MSASLVPWVSLVLAGLFEVAWALALKASHGFSRPLPSLVFVLTLTASMGLLAYAVKHLPLGTAYAIWVGIGTLGTVALGIVWFHEPFNLWRAASVLLILAGIIGLKLG